MIHLNLFHFLNINEMSILKKNLGLQIKWSIIIPVSKLDLSGKFPDGLVVRTLLSLLRAWVFFLGQVTKNPQAVWHN